MKHFAKRALSVFLTVLMLVSALSVAAFAQDTPPLYVNLGDSIAWGRIENEDQYPEYNWDENSYSGLFASYLGTTRTSYARRGMQTTDVLYMIDEEFYEGVNNGSIVADSWWQPEYPPFDGVSLEEVRTNVANADYISLCIGVCDYISYPRDVESKRLEEIGDIDATIAHLKELLDAGKIDTEVFKAFTSLLRMYSGKALVIVNYVLDMLQGYIDYSENYGRIVKDLREANPTATILLIGNYIPGGTISALQEMPEASPIIFFVNRLIDNINLISKKAAEQYNCLYVDTMGVESDWHPTVNGHQQICDRMIAVLNGEKTYAGSTKAIAAVTNHAVEKTAKYVAPVLKIVKNTVASSSNFFSSLLKK